MYQKSTEILITNGYKREAVQVLKSHARLLKQFANDCHIAEAKHDYLLQVLFPNPFSTFLFFIHLK
jgi:hypothetical protein